MAAIDTNAGFSLDALSKAKGLKSKIIFTLLALILYRICSFIPIPGVDANVITEFFSSKQGGLLGMFDMFSGGSLSRMAVLALNIMPYISASIIMQLLAAVSPELKAIKESGAVGQMKINQYTRYLTLFICIIQAFGISVGLEAIVQNGIPAVVNPGWFFKYSTIVTLTGGTMFVVWLGEQITQRGIGQGSSLIIFTGIIANLPSSIFKTLELGKVGQLSPLALILILALAVGVVALISYVEGAERRVSFMYPKQSQLAVRQDTSYLPLKVNSADVIPPIFASSLLGSIVTVGQFTAQGKGPEWLQIIMKYLGHGTPTYMLIYGGLIVFFAFFYTAMVFNPTETAENLKKSGGFIPGIRPGEQTAKYLDYVLTRLTTFGSIYLVFICLLPDFLISKLSVPFYLGGTTLLIVCNVITKTFTQIQTQLLASQYESVLKKMQNHKRFR
ncbi:MAG: preprotein translocase subunit SecY [Rickettsiales bacterium]|jgi:preprotein translocase subunit SecY|nr:preprotein translocase subunit SecY [Rickettsiales bacterium]